MKRILTSTNAVIFFLLFAVLVSINSCKNISGCTKERQKESWLFTQTAESGSVTYDKNSKIYTVKLKGANPITVKFTDIPVRKAKCYFRSS